VIPGATKEWDWLIAEHSAALRELTLTSRRVPSDQWNQPVAAAKWTPAEIVSHLIESYRVLRGELAGAPGMQLRLGPMKRWLLRRTVLPRILSTGNFPAGARAPRETRPGNSAPEREFALRTLNQEAEGFVTELSKQAKVRRVRLTHAYFGSMSARQSLQLATVHTRHHGRQMAAILTPQ
jgi:DinB superfamily